MQWLICVIAALGFAFDTYELLVLPLIVRPALMEMAKIKPGTPEFNLWVGLLFYIPAVAGGIFGLLGGYLTDRLGRRRVLVWSILIYAVSAMGAGFATSLTQLLILRCTTFIGVCMEFVAAVAWLAELFPNPRQREKGAGLHTGVLFHRRFADQRRVLPRGHLRSIVPRDSRRTPGVALYDFVRPAPRDSSDRRAPVPA
jgi:MFS family permease